MKSPSLDRPNSDPIIRYIRSNIILWLPTLAFGVPLFIRTAILVIIEALYNLYTYLFRVPEKEDFLLHKIIEDGKRSKGIAVVTGGNSGIGKEIVKSLLRAGYTVHLPVRNLHKAQLASRELSNYCKSGSHIQLYKCDLSKTSQVKNFLTIFKRENKSLDLLINCAGNYNPYFEKTLEGIETQMAVHVVGAYLLTDGLVDLLSASPIGRVVTVSSSAHQMMSSFNLNSLTNNCHNFWVGNYCNAKYAQTLLMKQLALNYKSKNVTVNTINPGMVDTDITREDLMVWSIVNLFVKLFVPWLMLKPSEGALTATWAALSKDLEGVTGRYFFDLEEEPVNWQIEKDLAKGIGKLLIQMCRQFK